MEKEINKTKPFKGGKWEAEIDVASFIESNHEEYLGDESFLMPMTQKTKNVWKKCRALLFKEMKKGLLDVDLDHFSGINSFKPGYIKQKDEVIFGLQTNKPLKRIMNPFGGIRMVESALKTYGKTPNKKMLEHFKTFRKTHNDAVYSAYTTEIKNAKRAGLITGLPDAYGRGRIIGDYRRVALFGVDRLIESKKADLEKITDLSKDENIRLREEVSDQINALSALLKMAESYGFNISKPATNAKEAFQWTYFAYLAAVKENNGAAMSLGRVSTFLNIFIERDLAAGILTEELAQELVDQFVIKLRLVRHLRTPAYDQIFGGDPTWVTESIAGMKDEKTSYVTKNSFRFLHTLENLDPSPEPNLTVLWSEKLPELFKKYCAKISIETDSIQYENDDVMKPIYGNDYAIACCVSAMEVGNQMQFFGARCNAAKAVLLAINGGRDENTNKLIISGIKELKGDELKFDEVWKNFKKVVEKMSSIYVDAMNIIHHMHDKYAYEAVQMALHTTDPEKLMAFGVAGLSVAADSLSAIKHAKVVAKRDENNIAKSFCIDGDFPTFGNDDDRVDEIAKNITTLLFGELKKHKLYKDAKHTLSVLTITSNVMYGEKTGATPDGRKSGEAFAPGANPMHGRDECGAVASLNSVAKIPYGNCCQDGVSNTFSIIPKALGKERKENLVSILDGYFSQGAQHLNVNVLNRELLIDAMNNPMKYPLLTIRVSGYAVNFNRLSKAHQKEVIARTFHERV